MPASDVTSTQSTAQAPAPQPRSIGADLAYVAVFAAVIWVFALMPKIQVGFVGVPITLQTLAIGMTGFILGPLRGFLATLLYVVLGLIGLPVFAGGAGGFGVMAGPSAGYIIGFPIFALGCGLVAWWTVKRFTGVKLWVVMGLLGLVASFLTVHPLGIAGMMVNAQLNLSAGIAADMPFWPGDVIKNFLAAAIAVLVHRAFPTELVRRA